MKPKKKRSEGKAGSDVKYRFDFVQVTVKDWQRAVEFYQKVLGLKPIFLEEKHAYGWLDAGPSKIAIRGTSRKPDRPGVAIHFKVDKIEDAIADLEKKGCVFYDKQLDTGEKFKVAYFQDPEGNSVSIWSEG